MCAGGAPEESAEMGQGIVPYNGGYYARETFEQRVGGFYVYDIFMQYVGGYADRVGLGDCEMFLQSAIGFDDIFSMGEIAPGHRRDA